MTVISERACDRGALRLFGLSSTRLAYRHPRLRTAELSVSSSLHSRARHFLSLVAAHGGLILLENPCSGWTPLSVPGCQCMPLSAHTFLPASSACRWLKPGLSGVTMMCCRLWVAAALTHLAFTCHSQASATLTAPLLRARRRAIRSPWLRPLRLAFSLFSPCCRTRSGFLTGATYFRPDPA